MTGMKIFVAVFLANLAAILTVYYVTKIAFESAYTDQLLEQANTVYVAPDPK